MLNLVQVDATDIQQQPAPTFDDFWLLWPEDRRVEKKAARMQWAKLTDEQQVAALTGLVDWRRVWAKKDPQYIPHPHRWLRDERWDDAIPREFVQRTAAQAPAKLAEAGERAPMPDKVREALAKMRRV